MATQLLDEVELRKLDELVKYANNPKEHPQEQIDKIAASIKEYGFVQPIVIDEEGTIIIGHGRYEAARQLELDLIPVIEASHLDEAQKKALRIADNEIAKSGWEEEKLEVELEQLYEMDIDIELTGYSEEDVQTMLEDKDVELDEASVDDDEEIEEVTWEEGMVKELSEQHVLACLDCTNSYEELLDGQKADLLITDPPYNANYNPDKRPGGDTPNRDMGEISNDDMSVDEYKNFLYEAFKVSFTYLRKGGCFYIHCNYPSVARITNVLERIDNQAFDLNISSCIIWYKNNINLTRKDFHTQKEIILYGWKRGDAHYYSGERDVSDVWEVDREHTMDYVHPTQKPVDLIQREMQFSSVQNDIILDPFAGSGTTLITAEQLKRRSVSLELDPYYCQVIENRYFNLTDSRD